MCAINGELVGAEYKYGALQANVKKIQYSCESEALQQWFPHADAMLHLPVPPVCSLIGRCLALPV